MNKYDKKYEIKEVNPSVNFRSRKIKEKEPNNYQEAMTFVQQMLTDVGRRQQKPGKVVKCSYCGKVFNAKGTRKYCYGDECKEAEKRNRQSIVDSLAAQIKKGLYANYKLFISVLPDAGETMIDYDKALKKGFDEHAFYRTYINKHNDIWHIVGEYYFTISHQSDDRFLHILKK